MRSTFVIAASLVATLLLFANGAHAVGEAGVPSLIIPPGARANGMGEAYVAIAQDATAAWWNPAGLAFLKNQQLAFMHSQLVPDLAQDVYYEFLGYSREVEGVGTLSTSVVYLTYGESIATNDQGDEYAQFTSWEGSFAGSFAMPVTNNFGVGLTMKFIHVDYAPANVTPEQQEGSGSSVAVDLGAMLKDEEAGVNLGMSLSNTGPDIALVNYEQSDPLPFTLRTGVAYEAVSDEVNDVLVAFDIEQSLVWLKDGDVRRPRSEIYHVGGEYRYVDLISARLGYIRDRDGDFDAMTYGLGFIIKNKISIDYASVPQAESLSRVHRWSFYLTF